MFMPSDFLYFLGYENDQGIKNVAKVFKFSNFGIIFKIFFQELEFEKFLTLIGPNLESPSQETIFLYPHYGHSTFTSKVIGV